MDDAHGVSFHDGRRYIEHSGATSSISSGTSVRAMIELAHRITTSLALSYTVASLDERAKPLTQG